MSITLPFYIAINVIYGHSCTLFPPSWLQVGNGGHSFINISILQTLPVVFSLWNFLRKRPYLFLSHLFLSCRHECIRNDGRGRGQNQRSKQNMNKTQTHQNCKKTSGTKKKRQIKKKWEERMKGIASAKGS